ncbi:MAG: pilus assembly protein N-terminal domain-containing protein [Pirellulaceae bacterium]
MVGGLTTQDAGFELKLGEARFLYLRKDLAEAGKPNPVVAVADPRIVSFEILPNPRLLRIWGLRPGTTQFSIVDGDGQTFSFRVLVVYDLKSLQVRLQQLFPDASIRLSQLREHIIVEGQARSADQIESILAVLRAYLTSAQADMGGRGATAGTANRGNPPPAEEKDANLPQQLDDAQPANGAMVADAEQGQRGGVGGSPATPQLINLMHIPGLQQIMLKVQVAELNRTALREIGSDLLFSNGGTTLASQVGSAAQVLLPPDSASIADAGSLNSLLVVGPTPATTGFAIFEGIDMQVLFRMLRRNSLLKILAEPHLVAMNGQKANFLAGGEFPVPISAGGLGNIVVEWRRFGVGLEFLPTIMHGNVIRLKVKSEVSSIDPSLGTTLVNGGAPIPGLSSRKVETTVELKPGKTLMLAGLLQVSLDASTQRIPYLGDAPIIGPLFRNTTGKRQEKELVLLVTPMLVEAIDEEETPSLPGANVNSATDLEMLLHGQIQRPHWLPDHPESAPSERAAIANYIRLEAEQVSGPFGYSR